MQSPKTPGNGCSSSSHRQSLIRPEIRFTLLATNHGRIRLRRSRGRFELQRPFHEPTVWSPGFSRSGPPEGGTPNRPEDPDGFVVPMHGNNDIHAFHGNALAPGKPI